MKSFIGFFNQRNWFFLSLTLLAVSLPFSESLISISLGLILFVVAIKIVRNRKILNIDGRFLWIAAIYILYLISFFFSADQKLAVYDLRKSLAFFVLPVSFSLGEQVNNHQKRLILMLFTIAVVLSSLYTLINFWFFKPADIFSIHTAGFISHIRFSFQLILSFWFLIFLNKYDLKLSGNSRIIIIITIVYILIFTFYQQSLTGLIALFASVLIFLFIQVRRSTPQRKWILFSLFLFVILFPLFYIVWAINKFYNIETVDPEKVEILTRNGNEYFHDFNNPMVENGKYVYLYVCEEEMREEWNRISEIKYDSAGSNGFPLKETLIRYLTSKGLRKDAEGVKSLTALDVENIKNGYANYIFRQRKLSLYPRIYQTIWEYYVFSNTGYVNYQSFSQRIVFMEAAITIIKNNFWFGVGIGNWKQAFEKAYENNDTHLKSELYGSAHNQYLNYFVKFGFAGLLFILFCLIYPVVKKRKYKDPLFLIFLIYLGFANLGDSNFESHVGGSFFVFFYCLFLSGDSIDYLNIGNETNCSADNINI